MPIELSTIMFVYTIVVLGGTIGYMIGFAHGQEKS